MSAPNERPWTEEEKYALLTEILKKAGVPSAQLVKLIKDFHISPSWADIPLPTGRSLNSCQTAFFSMCQQPPQPASHPAPVNLAPARHEPSLLPPFQGEGFFPKKRPLFPLDKPAFAPRAIQPRPPTSATSYSSESTASMQLSPRMDNHPSTGEPPRKRGRPSKAETERRRAAAHARGETYPPPRRSGGAKVRSPSNSTSPASGAVPGPSFSPPENVRSMGLPAHEADIRRLTGPSRPEHEGGGGGPGAGAGGLLPRRASDQDSRLISSRELPRPHEPGGQQQHRLSMPHMMHLAPREQHPILTTSQNPPEERYYDPIGHGRSSRADPARRSLPSLSTSTAQPESTPGPTPEGPGTGQFRPVSRPDSMTVAATLAGHKT